MKHKFGAFVAIVTGLFGVLAMVFGSAPAFAAGTATMTLSPASGSSFKGHSLSIKVYENSGSDPVNAVQANLSYSTSQLKYVSFSDSSVWNIEAENPQGDTGSLRFARGTITPLTGSQVVVTVNFLVKAGSGNAKINFESGSGIVRSTDNGLESLNVSGGSYTLKTETTSGGGTTSTKTSPPPPPPPSSIATFIPPTTSSVKPDTSSSSSSGAKLTLSSVQADNSSPSLGTVISWQTNRRATSTVLYGSDKDHLITKSDARLVTMHSITLPPDMLKSGATYYFYVSSTDSAGDTVSSQLLPFIAAGETVSTENNQKLTKELFTIVGIGAVILAAILALFGVYRLQQSMKEQRELRQHFPDLTPPSDKNGDKAITFQPSNTTPGSTTKPDSDQSNDVNKGS